MKSFDVNFGSKKTSNVLHASQKIDAVLDIQLLQISIIFFTNSFLPAPQFRYVNRYLSAQ